MFMPWHTRYKNNDTCELASVVHIRWDVELMCCVPQTRSFSLVPIVLVCSRCIPLGTHGLARTPAIVLQNIYISKERRNNTSCSWIAVLYVALQTPVNIFHIMGHLMNLQMPWFDFFFFELETVPFVGCCVIGLNMTIDYCWHEKDTGKY